MPAVLELMSWHFFLAKMDKFDNYSILKLLHDYIVHVLSYVFVVVTFSIAPPTFEICAFKYTCFNKILYSLLAIKSVFAPNAPLTILAPQAPQPILAPQALQTILAPQAPQTILAPQAPQPILAPQAPLTISRRRRPSRFNKTILAPQASDT